MEVQGSPNQKCRFHLIFKYKGFKRAGDRLRSTCDELEWGGPRRKPCGYREYVQTAHRQDPRSGSNLGHPVRQEHRLKEASLCRTAVQGWGSKEEGT